MHNVLHTNTHIDTVEPTSMACRDYTCTTHLDHKPSIARMSMTCADLHIVI
jgi:hypothetical protein